jgi:transposase-like protein
MTKITREEVQIIPLDARGRKRYTREHRALVMAEYERSGMSAMRFAKWCGINYSTLMNWIEAKREQEEPRKTGVAGGKEKVEWVEAVVEGGKNLRGERLIVQGPLGIRMEVGDENQARLAVEIFRQLGGEKSGC